MALGVSAALVNANFVLEGLLGPRRWLAAGPYISDLSAVGQPWGWVYRAADVLTGLLVVTMAAVLLSRAADASRDRARASGAKVWARTDVWLRTTAVCVLLFAVGTIGAAVFSLPCAESTCAASAPTAVAHSVFSIVGSGGAVVGSWALLVHARRRRDGEGGTAVAAAALTILLAAGLFALGRETGDGTLLATSQRAQVLAISAWIVLVTLTTRSRHR